MNMTIRPLRAEERKYTYAQNHQLSMQTSSIGYLRGDFGSDGKEFYTSWFDREESRKTDAFKTEFDEVINALRFEEEFGPFLANCRHMQDYASSHPDSAFEGSYTTEYGFRLDTADYAYLLRCNPTKGDYNFYCYCFEGKCLDRHLQNARAGIRFITPEYKEKFRIPDGDKIRIVQPDGESKDVICRYIDDCHLEVDSSLYHICEFAEIMEHNGSTVIPLRSSLPEKCFSVLPSGSEMIIIERGKQGYTPTNMLAEGKTTRESADIANEAAGITKAQEAAMLAGSMFGWHTLAADPKRYSSDGKPIKPKDWGDSR